MLLLAGAVVVLEQRDTSSASPQGPSNTRGDQREPENSATREPAELSDVRDAAIELEETLAGPSSADADWGDANRLVDELRERWISFKTPMRVNAGERMWTTSDVATFESALDATRAHIRAQSRAEAKDRIEQMRGLIDKYDGAREGRLQTGAGD